MDVDILKALLDRFQGCTFATLDAETRPKPGLRCVTTGERVILFTNKKVSGYEQMCRRRLEASGKNPDDFVLSDLLWGERVPDSPMIEHNGHLYLQTIRLAKGMKKYYVGESEVNPASFGIYERRTNQGLPPGEEVIVSTYRLDNIKRIVLMGEEIVTAEAPSRAILRLNHGDKVTHTTDEA